MKDYGIGIAKYDLEKVLTGFIVRTENPTQFQGLGIGLYISSEISKEHNSRMWAESEPGEGSIFYFSIPVS